MSKIISLVLFILVTSFYANGQKTINDDYSNFRRGTVVKEEVSIKDQLKIKEAQKGTYQFLCTNKDIVESYTNKTLEFIEENRLENEENIIQLSKYTSVRILSKQMINSSSFTPIKEEKIYVDQLNLKN